MEASYILAVDIGSTTVKCQVYNATVKIVGQAAAQTQLIYPRPGWIEIDPDYIWEAFIKVVNEAIKNARINLNEIAGLGLSTQRGTFITWNRITGKPYHNFISWNDLRADHLVKSWDNSYTLKGMRVGAKILHLISRRDRYLGASVLRLSNKHISMRLLWVMNNIPDLRSQSKNGIALFGTIDTWLIWKLTNGEAHVTDYSMASSSAMYDPYLKEWANWAFSLFNIPIIIMPEVKDTCGNIGACDKSLFGISIPILAMAGDQQAATFGHCCFDKGDVKCTLGTGTFLDINTGEKPHTSMAGLYPIIGWKYGSTISYLAEGSSNDTGSAIVWAQSVGLITSPAECESLAGSVDNSGGICFIPGFTGLQAPLNDDLACAGIIGLKFNTKREEIIRALIESLAFRVKQLFDTIKDEVNFTLHDLRVDGGVSKSNFILQLIADLTGKIVDRPTHTDMSCLGIAYLAGLAAGLWENQEQIKLLRESEQTFHPRTVSQELINSLNDWNKAVERCLHWYTIN